MMKLGPGPLRSGNNWEERGMSEIVQILISYESDRICSIQFAYVQNGGVRHSKKYGQDGRVGFDANLSLLQESKVTFDYPSEYLTYVSGRYKDHDRLTSIVFGTNKRKYGPFGTSTSTEGEFNYKFGTRSSFAGFYGTVYCGLVYAIGVYVKPIQSLAELNNKPIESLAQVKTEK
uniref:Jacalin-type lectin domain-containing protein n=1 Tax=Lactuca sativa TaxID=4236 RepID=A0A9R1UMS4_LACSA|nr:hypothetical protein LSAT_V11C800414960 [Lactuca sativa]